jgi:hypothetical protein
MQHHDEFPGVMFRIDGNSLFVEFDDSITVADQDRIAKELAAKLFDDSEVHVTIIPQKAQR